jgi:BirA family biotin operon repressor/biotin-[acetyl-CoA-carboxylase] ligase
MDQLSLESGLADLHLPAFRFFPSIGSTNDEALRWMSDGAPHLALVVADEQTAGRGRYKRNWVSTYGTGLAFSLILLSPPFDPQLLPRLSGLAALAARDALHQKYALPVQVKWPNDILIEQKKAGGVLVEAQWDGDTLKGVIVGIGINIAPESISPVHLPPLGLNFPVTCVEYATGHPVDRLEFLHAILQEFFSWLPRLSLPQFILEWETSLAFRDQWVVLSAGDMPGISHPADIMAPSEAVRVIGLSQDGSLIAATHTGRLVTVSIGEIHLRPEAAD